MCDQNYNEKFGNFKFFNENNDYLEVKYSDYITIDETGTSNICYAFIKINYETDLFIAGKYVMNNYYTIFDIDNNQLKTYPISQEYLIYDQRNVIIFLFVICIGGLVFLSCFCIYRNFCSRNTDEENNFNEDLIGENEGEVNAQENEGNNNQEEQNPNNIEMNNENISNNENNTDNDIIYREEIDKIELKDDIDNNDNNIINDNNLI